MPRKKAQRRAAELIDAQVGQRVRRRRELIGLSQEQLGHHLGLSFQQVQKYENGTNRISAGRLLQITDVLGIRIETLFEGLLREELPPDADAEAMRDRVMKFAMSREGSTWNEAYLNTPHPRQRKLALDVLRLPVIPDKT
jgi:transcriptional regulator with XRE-family HTH domain